MAVKEVGHVRVDHEVQTVPEDGVLEEVAKEDMQKRGDKGDQDGGEAYPGEPECSVSDATPKMDPVPGEAEKRGGSTEGEEEAWS
jgi:hypothetical protein